MGKGDYVKERYKAPKIHTKKLSERANLKEDILFSTRKRKIPWSLYES